MILVEILGAVTLAASLAWIRDSYGAADGESVVSQERM
jgi:hypothetical protein